MQYNMRQYRAEAQSHSHSDFHQIIISEIGLLEMEVEGRGGAVCGRHMAFVEAGKTHAYRAEGLNRFLVLDVDAELAHRTGLEALWYQYGGSAPYLEVGNGHQHGLIDLLDRFSVKENTSAALDKDLGQDEADRAMLDCLKSLLVRCRLSGRQGDHGALPEMMMPVRLVRAMAWAEARLGEDITIADIATIAAQSESSLFSAFQKYVGISPMRWLTEQRLQTAMSILRDPAMQLSMSDLASMVGFTDQSAFSRAFSRRFGCSPRAAKYKPDLAPNPNPNPNPARRH